MKIHTTIQSSIAALALTFVANMHAQISAAGAAAPQEGDKTAKPAPSAAVDPHAAEPGSMNISLAYEAFSLPIAKAGELQRKGLTDEELYKEFVSAGKLERLLVLRTKSGQRAILENVTEYRYPAEFSGPQLPGGVSSDKVPPPLTPPPFGPTAFEKKDAGDTMECEPTLSLDAKSVDFQIAVTHVALARREKWGKGITELEQPQFESQKLSTNFTASIGSPRLIGTLNPPFGNGIAARAEQNVWFCFITPTIAQNNVAAPTKNTR